VNDWKVIQSLLGAVPNNPPLDAGANFLTVFSNELYMRNVSI
jgi:hypothetical protein